jgi:AcrR family transcriptional regulator
MRASGVKEKVDRAAVALFATAGVDGVSIAEIAASAGVSQGALYRHYPSKEDLAWCLFADAYLRTGAELDALRAAQVDFAARVAAMVAHFCALYDRDPALFRFMLIAQHGMLPRLGHTQRTPIEVLADTVAEAVAAKDITPVDSQAAAAAIIGIVLQTAVFHVYGRLAGALAPRAAGLADAAIAAVSALGRRAIVISAT